MKKSVTEKTNAIRIIDRKGLEYSIHTYVDTNAVSGVEVARVLGQDEKRVFKTLVTVGKSGEHFVFMVPVSEELDLKKAAKAAGEKSLSMIKSKELLPLTGYVHGGCSPVGMKKAFKTFIDPRAYDYPTIFFSAGKIGYQIEMRAKDLEKAVALEAAETAG